MDDTTFIIIIAVMLVLIFLFGIFILIKIEQHTEYTWTKGIVMGDKVCDFVVVCSGSELKDLIYTGNCINISDWNGYQNKEWCNK